MRQELFFSRKHRVLALLLGAMIALTLLLGAAFVLVELHHRCTGEDCPICAAISQDIAYLRAEVTALPHLVFAAIALFAVVYAIAVFQQAQLRKPSLVTLKVKLSD